MSVEAFMISLFITMIVGVASGAMWLWAKYCPYHDDIEFQGRCLDEEEAQKKTGEKLDRIMDELERHITEKYIRPRIRIPS